MRKKSAKSFIDRLESLTENYYNKHKRVVWFVTTLLLIVWQWPLILTTDRLLSGDFDYFSQAYEAVRVSILHFHQFPWMNAWVGGGVPLYADPQVGVFSIQTILVLIFGAPFGLKLSLVGYSLVGFWSMFYLLKHRFVTPVLVALPLSVIWIANGFFTAHLVGHYTFALFALFPLLLYLQLAIHKKLHPYLLGLVAAILVLSAFHYAAFQSFTIMALVALFQIIANRHNFRRYFIYYSQAAIVFLILAGHRILYSVDYVFDFPRYFSDQPNQIVSILKTFIIPADPNQWFYDVIKLPKIIYSWPEYSAFVGYLFSASVVILGGYFLVHIVRSKCAKTEYHKPLGLLMVVVFFILMALGSFSSISPFSLASHLPMFSGMRVPSRWLIWAIFFSLVFIGFGYKHIKNMRLQGVILALIILGSFEVYSVSFGDDRFFNKPIVFRGYSAPFEQFEDFDSNNIPTDFGSYKTRPELDRRTELYSYEATLNNLGEAKGYEPIIDTRFSPTLRCGIVQGCNFVMTKNALVEYWSPNEIVLKRTGPGDIEINANPSNYWTINGQRLYASQRVAEVNQRFIITDSSEKVSILSTPRSPLDFLKYSVKKLLNR